MKHEPISIGDVEDVLSRASGRTITEYELNEDGLHIWLSDGGCLVFFGSFAVACVPPSEGYQ